MKTLSPGFFFMVCLILLLVKGSQQNPKEPRSRKELSEQILQKMGIQKLKDFNVIANQYFKGCSQNNAPVEIRLTNCSIPTKDYADFLLKVYQNESMVYLFFLYNKHNRTKELQELDDEELFKKIQDIFLPVAHEWIEIFKPNSEITIEQAYLDLATFDRDILDVFEHNPQKYKDLIITAKTYRTILPQTYFKAEYNEQMMWKKYIGNHKNWLKTPISTKQFVYFVRQLLAYHLSITLPDQKHKYKTQFSQDIIFAFTSKVKKQVQKLQHLLGDNILYDSAAKYAVVIIENILYNPSETEQINLTSLPQTEQTEKKSTQINQENCNQPDKSQTEL